MWCVLRADQVFHDANDETDVAHSEQTSPSTRATVRIAALLKSPVRLSANVMQTDGLRVRQVLGQGCVSIQAEHLAVTLLSAGLSITSLNMWLLRRLPRCMRWRAGSRV